MNEDLFDIKEEKRVKALLSSISEKDIEENAEIIVNELAKKISQR